MHDILTRQYDAVHAWRIHGTTGVLARALSAIQQGGNACKNYIHPLMTIFVLSQSQQMIDNL